MTQIPLDQVSQLVSELVLAFKSTTDTKQMTRIMSRLQEIQVSHDSEMETERRAISSLTQQLDRISKSPTRDYLAGAEQEVAELEHRKWALSVSIDEQENCLKELEQKLLQLARDSQSTCTHRPDSARHLDLKLAIYEQLGIQAINTTEGRILAMGK